jgi:hypothetical protein
MNLIIQRLQKNYCVGQSLGIDASNPLNCTLADRINTFSSDIKRQVYQNLVKSHVVLSMEYSLLGQQICANLAKTRAVLLADQESEERQMVEQLMSAILLAELLEQVYTHYLNVPREVERMQVQQKLYRKILKEIRPELPEPIKSQVNVGASFSHRLRMRTLDINLFRLLFVRSKRVLDLIANLDGSAHWYRHIIADLDKHTDPFLPYIGLFYLPRLTVNLFLLMKHSLPGPWMSKEEQDVGFAVRFQGQLLRRWFELGNDLAWVALGAVNGFVLLGTLAPVGVYLSIAVFGFDVAMSAGRAYIELNRLRTLRKEYEEILAKAENPAEIKQLIKILDDQIKFEILRFGSHVMTTSLIFFAMCCSAPIFAANPVIPLVGAVCLIVICFLNFALVPIINHYRPQDMVPVTEDRNEIRKLGFFASQKLPESRGDDTLASDANDENLGGSYSPNQ